MSDNFEPRDELTERLSALGSAPISPALQSEHLTALAGVARGASWRSMLASRVKLGAAVLGGFLIGTTGLASAGAMGPLQPIAKTTVEAVTPFEMPEGKGGVSEQAKKNKGQAKKADKGAKPADDLTDAAGGTKFWGDAENPCLEASETISHANRGQYLKSVRESLGSDAFKTARESYCGKSISALNGGDDAKDDKPEDTDQGKSTGNRKDDKAGDNRTEGGRGGNSDIEEAPGTTGDTPADPAPAPETPATPEAEGEAPKNDNAEKGSANSENSGRTDS